MSIDEPRDSPRQTFVDRWPLRRIAGALFVVLTLLYHANLTDLEEGDAVPSTALALAIVKYGQFSFDADRWPEMFKWKASPPFVPTDDFFFRHWSVRFAGKSARAWRDEGKLELLGPRYYIVESKTEPGRYVSTFGPIPGLVALPVTAALYQIDPRLDERFLLRLSIAKLHGSLMVAGVAALLFLIAARYTTRRRALLLGVVYGLGTCAFAISSQSLWQQTVNQLFLALGAYFFVTPTMGRRQAGLAGLFFGAAAACRSTSLIPLACVGIYLLLRDRRNTPWLALCALPVPLAIAAYNYHYFGSPFSFGQEIVGHTVALEKTGSPDLWQTPLLVGLKGLLFSPSRGMLVLSPIMVLSTPGIVYLGLRRDKRPLVPLAVASVVMMGLQCKWFDWWGGWAYGYRPWLDVVPYLVLLMLPILDDVMSRPWLRRATYVALAASIFVQGLGALAYDRSWNTRLLFVIRLPHRRDPVAYPDEREARAVAESRHGRYVGPTLCNIDSSVCRHRLWDWTDSIVPYHITHFSETRGRRKPSGWSELAAPYDANESAIRAHVH